jgi:hypothetical protein
MEIPKTGNRHFDEAVIYLLQYHQSGVLGGLPVLDLSNRPVGLRSDRAWQRYYDALTNVLGIGQREGWVRLHVNRQGVPVFIAIDVKESNHGKTT